MGLFHLRIKLLLPLLAIALPIWVMAEDCTTWVLCPYVPVDDDPTTVYVSLSNSESLRLIDNVRWYEIPVAGREDELGQAVVCIYADEEKELVDEAAEDGMCQVLAHGQVNARLVAPYHSRFNAETGKLEFLDGKGGRPRRKGKLSIDRNIRDEIVRPTREALESAQ